MQNRALYRRTAIWPCVWCVFLGLVSGVALMVSGAIAVPEVSARVEEGAVTVPGRMPAAVVCGKFDKKGILRKVKLDTPSNAAKKCVKNGWAIISSIEQLETDVDVAEVAIGELDMAVGTYCAGLELATSQSLSDPCNQYVGDRAACLAHFVASSGTPVSCTYFRGNCFACIKEEESVTKYDGPICTNQCLTDRPQCIGDPNRTVFAGWLTGDGSCEDITSEGLCNIAYYAERFADRQFASSCRWVASDSAPNGGDCYGCTAYEANDLRCEDSKGSRFTICKSDSDCNQLYPGKGYICMPTCRDRCEAPPPIACADSVRRQVLSCSESTYVNGEEVPVNQRTCAERYEVGSEGAESCYWKDYASRPDQCLACDFLHGIQNQCGDTQSNRCVQE